MPRSVRFQFGVKGAILWVFAMALLGLLFAMLIPGEGTMGLPWITTAVGIMGGLAHFTVAMVKKSPERVVTTGAAVALLATAFTLAAVYWISGSTVPTEPWPLAREAFRITAYVLAPIVGISYLVLRVLRAKSAA